MRWDYVMLIGITSPDDIITERFLILRGWRITAEDEIAKFH